MSETLNPSNPFNEPHSRDLLGIVAFDPARYAASMILHYMAAFPTEVITTQTENITSRLTFISCRGPYNDKLDVYMNPMSSPEERAEADRMLMRTNMEISAAHTKGELPHYGVRLYREDRGKFGISGISRPAGSLAKIEMWDALKTEITFSDGVCHVGLIGEQINKAGELIPLALLRQADPAAAKEAGLVHCQTIYTVLGRVIRRRLEEHEGQQGLQ